MRGSQVSLSRPRGPIRTTSEPYPDLAGCNIQRSNTNRWAISFDTRANNHVQGAIDGTWEQLVAGVGEIFVIRSNLIGKPFEFKLDKDEGQYHHICAARARNQAGDLTGWRMGRFCPTPDRRRKIPREMNL
jgi:hypothetical protein